MTDEKSSLEKFKESYVVLQKKHNLPDFDELNQDFKLEKLSEIETDYLIREIRFFILESLENFLRLIEAFLNPVNVPMFLYPIVKSIGSDEKTKLMDLHKNLAKIMFDSMKLINYDEDREAELIKKGFKIWQEVKRDFSSVLESVENKLDIKKDKGRNYFG